ncbi:ester cyclase [Novosphingobium malaysiense]|uniref:SnoaL-like domain-containing protein n=1 Tax=Novosphingobium malaysiense TaxID=1348853 RepID=A0A0B1ZKI0_9SPHN|nr:nuclear transport factor 2 family protein [Novosphingobium malaysiense]KHK89800.1 hypothetical protein LK12_17905 [Novosphingobium malaysiense]
MIESTTTAAARHNEALVRDYLGWTERGDLDATLRRVWAEKIAYHGRELGEITTRDGLYNMLSGFAEAMTGIVCDLKTVLANDEYVLAIMDVTGSQGGDDGAAQPVTFSGIDMWRVRDGKLVEQWVIEGIADHLNPDRARVE